MRSKRTPKSSSVVTETPAQNGTEARDETTLLVGAEDARRAAEQKYRDIFENAVEGIFQTRPGGGFIIANPALARMLGFESPEELIRARAHATGGTYYVHPERRAELKRLLDQNDTVRGFEFEAYRKDGTKVWMSDNVRAVRDPGGKLLYYEGTVEDITERKQMEETLRRSEMELTDFFENAATGLHWVDSDGTVLRINQAELDMLGYTRDECLGHNLAEFHVDRDVVEDILKRLRSGEVLRDYEARRLCKDGSIKHVSINSSVYWEEGKFVHSRCFTRDITERKRAEEELRSAKEFSEKLIQTANVIVLGLDMDARINIFNKTAERISGYTFAELEGKSWFDTLVPREKYPHVWEEFGRLAVSDNLPNTFENPLLTKNGEERYIAWRNNQVSVNGKVVGTISFGNDITERKMIEIARSEAERKYRDIFENAVEGIFQTTPAGGFLSANPVMAHMLGYESPEELIRERRDIALQGYVDPNSREEFRRLLEKQDTVAGFEKQVYRKDRTKIWISENVRAVRDASGKLLYYEGTVEDITERKQAEVKSVAFGALARKLSGARVPLHAAQIIVNTAGELFGWDSCTFDLYDPGEDLIHDILRIDTIEGLRSDVPSVLETRSPTARGRYIIERGARLTLREAPFTFDDDMLRFGDRDRPSASIMSVPIRHASEVVGILSIQSYEPHFYDHNQLSDLQSLADHCGEALNRIRAEEGLRESEERYRELFENDRDAIYVHDLSGKYTSVNRSAERLSGYAREEILGKSFLDFVAPEYVRQVGENLGKKIEELGVTNYEAEIINRRGTRVPVEVTSRLIYENGVAVGVQGSARDITERKRAQEALLTYSRRLLEAQESERGRIARELHDQIGQMLTALKLNLNAIQSARDESEAQALIEDNLKMIDGALEQVRDLSVDLRPLLLDDLGLVTALHWYVTHQAQRAGARAEFISDSLDSDLRFSTDLETACFRIAQEALTNVARHARAKTVTVRLSRNRDYLILLIEDDGVGFDMEALQGQALASATLGLRGMQERAHAVGGRIKIDSAIHKGTQVFVELPIAMPNGRRPLVKNE